MKDHKPFPDTQTPLSLGPAKAAAQEGSRRPQEGG